MSQFVPLKIDTGSTEFREWSQDYKSEGNSIPILYIVRADGEMVYGESGSLSGDKLPDMLIQSLRYCGKVLSPREVESAEAAFASYEKLYEQGDVIGAVKALNKVKRIGNPGEIESYAGPAVKINEAVKQLSTEVAEKMKEQLESLQSDDSTKQVEALLDSYQLKRDYGTLKVLKRSFSDFARDVSKLKELKPLTKEVKIIDAARIAKSKTSMKRGVDKLNELSESSEVSAVTDRAKKEVEVLTQRLEDSESK